MNSFNMNCWLLDQVIPARMVLSYLFLWSIFEIASNSMTIVLLESAWVGLQDTLRLEAGLPTWSRDYRGNLSA